LKVAKQIRLSRGGTTEIALSIQNGGTVNGVVPATIVGTQNNVVVYNQTVNVSAPVGKKGATNINFPSFVATNAGTINWTATIADANADNDTMTAVTKVTQ